MDGLTYYSNVSGEYTDEDEYTIQNEDISRNLTKDFETLDSETDYSTSYQTVRESRYHNREGHQRQKKRMSPAGSIGKPPLGPPSFHGSQTLSTIPPNDAPDVKEVYEELQEINKKLKTEFKILHERDLKCKEKEREVVEKEKNINRYIQEEVTRRMAEREQQLILEVEKLDSLFKEKMRENKRLQDNFNTLKSSNDSLKKEMDTLQSRHEKLEKQSQSLQARLINLQRKQEYEERKDANLPPDLAKVKQIGKKEVKEKLPKAKMNTTQDVLSVLLEWISDSHLRQAISDQPTKEAACPADFVQEKCLKTFPQLVDILKEASSSNSKFILPCLQYMYWALLHLEQGKGGHKSALSSTLRRLGEELYRQRLVKIPGDEAERPVEGFFFHSQNLHVRFLSSLIILKSISQVDHLAHVFDVLRNDLKLDTAKELFIHYQATPVILQHMKMLNKTLLNASIDTHLQMSMESQILSAFLESCSTETWFRNVSAVWKMPNTEHKLLEKLSIILQKLSKIKSNRKYFEVFGMINSSQEMMRNLNNDQESAFLNLNLKSIIFNLSVAKGIA